VTEVSDYGPDKAEALCIRAHVHPSVRRHIWRCRSLQFLMAPRAFRVDHLAEGRPRGAVPTPGRSFSARPPPKPPYEFPVTGYPMTYSVTL
jgi:hypothetical protein